MMRFSLSNSSTNPTLGAASVGHQNNLNLIRMVLATSVLVSHSVPLVQGQNAPEPFATFLHFSLGGLAVYGFFAISGFLVTQSLLQRADIVSYFLARALRIFPGLTVALLLTLFVLGPFATTNSLAVFASSRETWTYFPANLSLLRLQYDLPGVFQNNPYPNAINGSLWTLPMECGCYVALAIFWAIGGLKPGLRGGVTVICVTVFVAAIALLGMRMHLPERVSNFAYLSFCFVSGSAFYFWRASIPLNRIVAVLVFCVIVAINRFVPCIYLVCIAYFYALFAFGFVRSPLLDAYNRLGDYSYGMYIYAFPIEQTCVWLIPGISPSVLCAVSAPATLLVAVVSWYFVERPALSLKQRRLGSRLRHRKEI